MTEWKEYCGAIASIVAALSIIPYVISIFKKKTVPHLFTWLVWSTLNVVIYAIQVFEKAGPGSWHMAVMMFNAVLVLILSCFYGERNGSRFEWMAFAVSLSAIPLWLIMKDATASAILLTIISVLAFYPTVSKTWKRPEQEDLFYYTLWMVRFPLASIAIENMNLPNLVYPVTWSVIGFLFVGMLLYRRSVLS